MNQPPRLSWEMVGTYAHAADSQVWPDKSWVVRKEGNQWYAYFDGSKIAKAQGGPAQPLDSLDEARRFCQNYEDQAWKTLK